MGYKHTIEIITKDIQDIEKLVGNFENYSRIPRIELDLALSKLRNVYELLLLFREEENVPVPSAPKTVDAETEKKKPEPAKEPSSGEEDEAVKTAASPSSTQPAEQPVQEDKPAEETPPESAVQNHTPPQPEKPAGKTESENHILAEKYKNQRAFVNEKLAENVKKQDLSSRLQSTPITSIAGSMGINDKFFFIRELFDGDAGKFRATMENLEHASSFKEASHYLSDNFEWDMESTEVQQLLNLVKRKFIH